MIHTLWLLHAAGWCVFWAAIHFSALRILNGLVLRVSPDAAMVVGTKLDPISLSNLRKHLRCLLYYAIASTAGCGMFVRFFNAATPTEPILFQFAHAFDGTHATFFSMGLAHWVSTLFEDCRTRTLVAVPVGAEIMRPYLFGALTIHHIMAIACYAVILSTRHLGILGVVGLVFELPVIAVSIRDIIVDLERFQVGMVQRAGRCFWCNWGVFPVLLTAGRLVPGLAFLFFWWSQGSMAVEWRDTWLASLPGWEVACYYVFGCVFTAMGTMWAVIISTCLIGDLRQYRGRGWWAAREEEDGVVLIQGGEVNGEEEAETMGWGGGAARAPGGGDCTPRCVDIDAHVPAARRQLNP